MTQPSAYTRRARLGSMKTARVVGLLIWTVGALAVTQTRGETIDLLINDNRSFIAVMGCSSTSCAITGTDLTALNAALAADGSGYQFLALSGTSNFTGSPSLGTLSLNGEIQFKTGNPHLTIDETESGFTLPNGIGGTLTSSSGATFTNTNVGDFQTFRTFLGLFATPPVTLTSTGGTNNQSGSTTSHVTGVIPPYALFNAAEFSLSAPAEGSSTDSFGVTAAYNNPVSVTPEPASMLLFGTGLVALGVKLRRRKSDNLVTA